MQAILWPIVQWLLQKVLIQFVVLSSIVALVGFLVPIAIGFLAPFLGVDLTGTFSAIPASVWWMTDAFRLDYGIPLMISAYVARFTIRRLPVIG